MDHFVINHPGLSLQVERLKLPGHSAFRIMFQDGRKPLVIARASNADAAKFWTSIPEGRQKEANEVGSLIETYLNKIQDSGFKVSGPTCNPNPES